MTSCQVWTFFTHKRRVNQALRHSVLIPTPICDSVNVTYFDIVGLGSLLYHFFFFFFKRSLLFLTLFNVGYLLVRVFSVQEYRNITCWGLFLSISVHNPHLLRRTSAQPPYHTFIHALCINICTPCLFSPCVFMQGHVIKYLFFICFLNCNLRITCQEESSFKSLLEYSKLSNWP